MSWEILGLVVIALIVVLLIIFRSNPLVQKYWQVSFLLIPIVALLVIRIYLASKANTPEDKKKVEELDHKIGDIRQDIVDVQTVTAIQVAAARAKDQAKIDELKAVKEIPDKVERRRRLAAMVG